MNEETKNLTEKGVDVKIISKSDNDEKPITLSEDTKNFTVKLYGRRWCMLALYILYSVTSNAQWIEYSIISNIVAKYYNVSSMAVDWTAMSFMFSYVVIIIPISLMSDRLNVRATIMLGCFANCLGAWVKTFSVSPERFYVLMIGQFCASFNQALMLPLPGRLAAKWFGSSEQSTATSLGIFGIQLGVSVSFILPPLFVRNHDNSAEIEKDLKFLAWFIAIFTSLTLILVTLVFQDEPKLPPSETRALQKNRNDVRSESVMAPLGRLFTNRHFLSLCNSYGLMVGNFNAIATLLNQMYLMHFENGEKDAGEIGLLIIVSGMIGSVVCGIVLDRTHEFKITAIVLCLCVTCGQMIFSLSLVFESRTMIYITAGVFGFFMNAYLTSGYENCTEFTYPEDENLSAGILNIANNVYGVIFTLIFGKVLTLSSGDWLVHAAISAVFILATAVTISTKNVLRRQDARFRKVNDSLYHSCNTSDVEDEK